MTTTKEPRVESDRPLATAQAALLAAEAPGAVVRRVDWSRGSTQVLELGTGSPLLLVHGGLDNAFTWSPVLAPLAATGRHVVAVDLPGHGLADPFDYSRVDLVEVLAGFLGDVLDGLGLGSADVAGASVGGFAAVALALTAPDRVRRSVLVGAPPGVTRDVPRELRAMGLPLVARALGRLLMSNPTRDGDRRFFGKVAVAHPERLSAAFLDADVASQRRNRASHLSLLGCLLDARGLRRRWVLGERWRELRVPMLFLRGTEDHFVAPNVAKAWSDIAADNRGIRTRLVDDAGHLLWFDQPERVVAEIHDFLRTSVPAAERHRS